MAVVSLARIVVLVIGKALIRPEDGEIWSQMRGEPPRGMALTFAFQEYVICFRAQVLFYF